MKDSKTPLYKTYSGTDPYVFISYSHADAKRVLPVIGVLDGDRVRLWYDAGIEAGTNWPEVVASHLLHAGTVVFFLSESFLRSQNCIREVHYAVSQGKPMICVYLEPVVLPNDLAMQFSTATVIGPENGSPEGIASETEALTGPAYLGDGETGYRSVYVNRRKKNVWRVLSILFASFFLLTLLFVIGYFADWFPFIGAKTVTAAASPDDPNDAAGKTVEITEFRDSVSRDILLSGYAEATLYFCGNTMVSDPTAIRRCDGTWYVGNAKVEAGNPSILELVVQKESVSYLALVNERIESFDALSAMPQLTYLDISGNPVGDLAFLGTLSNLKTLKLIDVAATDYSVLRALPALETVTVDYASAEAVLDALGDRAVDVIVKR